MKGIITDLKPMAIHDGPGIRTTVFFKGCPLKCLWCHNPETLRCAPPVAFYQNKCVGCGTCKKLCPTGAKTDQGLQYDLCIGCGACVSACPADALQLFAREVTLDSLLPLLLEDRPFYDTTGGGVTLSGGECLLQADFCAALLEKLKKEGIHTAVDTCGCVSPQVHCHVDNTPPKA